MAGPKVCKMYSDVDNLALFTHHYTHYIHGAVLGQRSVAEKEPSGWFTLQNKCEIQHNLHWTEKIKWPLLVRLRLKHFLLNICDFCDLQCNHHHHDKTETLKCYGIRLVPSVCFNSSFDVIRLLPSLFDWEGSQRNWTWRWYICLNY